MRFSLIIPTIGRVSELRSLFATLRAQTRLPGEIIVVVQGNTRNVSMLATEFSELPIRIIEQAERSLTKARNRGVAVATGDVIGFLDDDCALEPKYVAQVEDFFAKHPAARGVQGVITNFEEGHAEKVGGSTLVYAVYTLFARFFLLNAAGKTNTLLLSGRNRYASRVDATQACQWMSGIGNYRRDVFNEFKFDEALTGYALGEDKLFSYPISQKYPGSLWIDPEVRCRHDYGEAGRPVGKDAVAMKIRYTHYVWQKLMRPRGVHAALAYWWANLGDLFAVFMSVLMRKNSLSFFKWHVVFYWQLV